MQRVDELTARGIHTEGWTYELDAANRYPAQVSSCNHHTSNMEIVIECKTTKRAVFTCEKVVDTNREGHTPHAAYVPRYLDAVSTGMCQDYGEYLDISPDDVKWGIGIMSSRGYGGELRPGQISNPPPHLLAQIRLCVCSCADHACLSIV